MGLIHRFERRVPLPLHPTFPTHCPVCHYHVSIEMQAGRVVTYCAGCRRNAERAALGLPPVTYQPPPRAPEPAKPPHPRPKSSLRRRAKVAFRAEILRKLPKYPSTAATTRELANSVGTCKQKALDALYALRAEGRCELIECYLRGGRGLKWYRITAHETVVAREEAA